MTKFSLPFSRRPSNVVVLTGAGISQESGIRTFRASDGLWEDHRIEDVATPEGFARDPALVHQFYNARREQLLADTTHPNSAHDALAALESLVGGELLVVTQNVDDLHERAGQKSLVHMHGELLKIRCEVTGQVYPAPLTLTERDTCDCCGLRETLRPDIVWFGEMPMEMDRIYQALAGCELFISIGTSGNVYPAAGFCREAKLNGAVTLELNLEPSSGSTDFDYTYYGPAGTLVPEFVDYFQALPQ
ncbi:Sir2 family NAD+-dependent deacetylase [Corallincola platygyrae]|uniref:NAD-dependent protein deacylase n=1 Tax=Corallincola platygyrae TaxID=1193278 RepID=A0ABW4XKV9_9GAMM